MTVVIFYPSKPDNLAKEPDIQLNNQSFSLLFDQFSEPTESMPLKTTKILCGSEDISFSHFTSGCLFIEQNVQINQEMIDQISARNRPIILIDSHEPKLDWTSEKPLLIRGLFIPEFSSKIDNSSYYAFRSWIGQLAKDLMNSSQADILRVNCHELTAVGISESQIADHNSAIIKEKPVVSVILPSFERANFLNRALESLARQTLKNFEALIITNQNLAFNDPRFKIIKVYSKLPVSAARNTGLSQATGKYIAYLDDDDFYLPDHLKLLSESLERTRNLFAASICSRLWEEDCNSVILACDRPFQDSASWAELLTGNRFPTPAVMHVNDINLRFDESLECMEDWDLWLRASKKSDIDFIAKVTAVFSSRPNKTSISSSKKLLFHWYAYPIWAKHLNKDFSRQAKDYFINHLKQHSLQIVAAFQQHATDPIKSLLPQNITTVKSAISELADAGFIESEIRNSLFSFLARSHSESSSSTNPQYKLDKPDLSKPDVSVIVPLYNGLSYTKDLWQSILSTPTTLKVEYIFVDNCSKDGTREWLRNLGSKITAILNEQNRNFAGACNQGGRAAKADILVFLNNDTLVTDGWLEELIKPILQDSTIGITGNMQLFPNTQRIHHAGIYFDYTRHPKHYLEGIHWKDPRVNFVRECKAVTGACFAIRKADFLQLEGFYEEYKNGYEDVDLCLRLLRLNKKIIYTPKSLIYHHVSKSIGRTNSNQNNWQLFVNRCYPVITSDLKDFIRQNSTKDC